MELSRAKETLNTYDFEEVSEQGRIKGIMEAVKEG